MKRLWDLFTTCVAWSVPVTVVIIILYAFITSPLQSLGFFGVISVILFMAYCCEKTWGKNE